MNDEAKLATDRGTQDTAPTSAEKAWPQPSANVTNTDDAKAPTDGEETNSDEHNIIESPNLKLPAMASPFSDMDSSLDVNPPENATTTSPASFNPAPAASNPSIATLSGGLQRIAKENAAKEAARASRGSTMVGAGVPGAVLQKSQQRQEDAKKASTSTDARTKPAPTTTVSRGLRRSAEERVAKAAARGNAGNATSGAFPTVPPGGNLNPETIASKNVMVVAPIQHGVYYVAASATSSATTGARSSVSTSRGLGKNRKEADPLRESTDATITKCGVLVPPQRNNSAHDNDITTGTQENNTSKEFSSDLNPPENTVSTNQAFMEDASVVVPAATNAIQMPTISTSDDGLVEARAITESSMFMLQEAQEVDDAVLEQQTARQEKERHCQRVGYAIIFGSIIIIITISLGVGLRPKPEAVKDAMPTLAPTLAPTSLESFLLSLLPEQTITGMEDNDSAQYQAFKWLQEDPFVYDYPDWRILQRHALMTVFYATAGPTQWSNNTGWGSYHLHECAWFQNQEFALKSFIGKLYPGFLTGFLEPLPGSQCDKQGRYLHLWLDQNNLEGSLPEELYSLTSLQTLSAGLNPLYGSFSSYIGQLQQLRGLAFSSTGLSGSIPKEMGNISSFEVIVLNDNQLEGSIPNEIWQLSTLDSLVLGRNEKLGGTMPSIISTLPKLRWLLMDDCALTGSIPTELGQARSLEWLALLGNQLSGTLPSELGSLSKLWLLSLYGNLLEGTLPSELGLLTSAHIILRHNLFTGALPSELGRPPLQGLVLESNQLSGTIPRAFSSLSNLEYLSLGNNSFTGTIPSEFGLLTSLGRLTMENNLLHGTVPVELASLQKSLYSFRIEGNRLLSGVIPEPLCTVNGTCIGKNGLGACQGPFGSSFDCTQSLCGCDCPC